jgi:hypothetical protein
MALTLGAGVSYAQTYSGSGLSATAQNPLYPVSARISGYVIRVNVPTL